MARSGAGRRDILRLFMMRSIILVLFAAASVSAQVNVTSVPDTLPGGLAGYVYSSENGGNCIVSTFVPRLFGSGGFSPFTLAVTAGALPPGVTMSPEGVFSGTTTAAGSYSFTVRTTDGQGNIGTVDYTIDVGPAPVFACDPYAGSVGSTFTLPLNCGGPFTFDYSIASGALPPGLTLDSSTGTISGRPTQPGLYSFDWRCTIQEPPPTYTTIRIQVAVSPAAATLTATPSTLSFLSSPGNMEAERAAIAIQGSSGAGYQAAVSTESGGAWLSVSAAAGALGTDGTQTLQVIADSATLAPGVYVGSVAIQADGASIAIPVILSKTRLEKQLQLTQTGVTINLQQGAPAHTRSFFDVLNSGSGGIAWTATATTQSGGNWLRPTQTSGTTGQSQSSLREGAIVDPSGLAPGAYYGSIQITAADAANSPQRATVVLNVRPAAAAVTPLVQPQGALLVGQTGDSSTISRFFRVFNTSAAVLRFTVSSTTEDGGDWLPSGEGSLLPSSGPPVDITPGQQIRVVPGGFEDFGPLVRTDGLERGIYRGLVTLSVDNGTSVNLRIVLVMTPPTTALTLEGGKEQVGGCTPNVTVPVVTELGGGGPPASGWAQPISVQVVDDCGNPVNSGSAAAGYSGVDSPQTVLTNLGGEWNGTWTPPPTGSDTEVEVTVTATNEDGVTGESSETVTVETNELAPPIVAEGGVVQGASFAREPLALGSIVSLFGSDLSPLKADSGGAGATSLPLTTELGNTRITLGGEPLPLLFVREDQVNAILPFELGERAADDLPLVVERTDNQSLSTAQKIVVSSARPGIFTQTGAGTGPGSILNEDYELVIGDNPATAGDAIVVFATGLGPTNPSVATGDAAPSQEPLARAANDIRVTIAGIDAQVLFAGLSPGFAGLFQVNIVVPEGVGAGEAELIIYSGGQPSQVATVSVR